MKRAFHGNIMTRFNDRTRYLNIRRAILVRVSIPSFLVCLACGGGRSRWQRTGTPSGALQPARGLRHGVANVWPLF